MNNKIQKLIIVGSMLCCGVLSSFGVPVYINSGNPAYPFPQFLEYTYGKSHSLGNLGTKNAEGVVHAELEQDIRDAYQIHANEFFYTGEEWGGYKYIETPYKSAYDCTEGDGYGLLAAAYMGDAVTFNGYWMCTHDKRRGRSKKYTDCTPLGEDYAYGPFNIGDTGPATNTAADGDVDVALALYVAYKQWGEFMRDSDGNIVEDACGNPISYKQEMINVIRGLVALSTRFSTETAKMRVNSGLIGLDGYPKGGDTWNEQTKWATANPKVFETSEKIFALPGNEMVDVKGVPLVPEYGSGDKQHIDYDAPAYYREFWELFEQIQNEAGIPDFEIEQFKRGEASSDWMMGDMISKGPKAIPTAGWSEISDDGSKTAYTNFNQGEDWRCSWRTISNYMWHGNPVNSWDPKTHKAVPGSNTYEYDAAVRLSEFLNNPIGWADGECMTYGDPKIPYSGPATTEWQYDPVTGATTDPAHFMVINWQNGTGSFSAVSAQDYDLMGTLYRQCAIEWDAKGGDDVYLGSRSNYMHGWARQLGMMVTSGNYHAPSQMNPMANMKIYRAIEDSVTYCYTGDQIKFLLDYRNYGSVDAKNVIIVENVPEDFIFVEASGNGVYNPSNHTVTWNIGTVAGLKSDNKSGVNLDFESGNLAKTVGQVWYKLKASDKASGRYCTTAEIKCSNGLGWTTNEYPNYVTATMQRNCVDVVARSLIISKDVDRRKVNDGNMAKFTINFENSSEAGWIDGGRPRVNVSFANGQDGARLQLMARLFNDAIEPYINYGNYRISYYLYDSGIDCFSEDKDCNNGWGLQNEIYEGGKVIASSEGVVVSHENIVEGTDDYGRWNQRMIIQFAPLFVTTTMHTSRFFGGAGGRVHKGGTSPMRGVWALFPGGGSTPNWEDDWSWSSKYNSVKDGLFYPVTPSWQKLDENGKSIEEPVTKWLTCGCTESDITVPNILVEEYDGYVWRRILGNGPMAGRDVDNVVIKDTLPKGLKFNEFVNECPLSEPEFGGKWEVKQTADGRDVIIWSIPKLQVKQKGSIIYTAIASFPSGNVCETPDEDIINAAWISGDKNSPICDTALITVTCAKVPKPIIPNGLTKTVDKEKVMLGDEVTYSIEYEQTHGAIIKNALDVPSEWTAVGNSIREGVLGISDKQTTNFKKSLSTNLYLEFDADIDQYQDGEFFLRNDIRVRFNKQYAGMTVTCFDGNKEVESQLCQLKNNPSRWKVKITDDVLQIWFGTDTSKSAQFTASGLTIKEGYFGFRGVVAANHRFSNIHVHTDVVNEFTIVDRIPAEIKVLSIADGGVQQGDSIVWKISSDKAIPFGTKFNVSWTGEVMECNELIENIAYALLPGYEPEDIMDNAVSECTTDECEGVKSALASLDNTELCEGAETVLRVEAKPEGKFLYDYYLDDELIEEGSKFDTLVVSKAGEYKVKVYDPSCTDASPVSTKAVILTIFDAPTKTVGKDQTLCADEELDLSLFIAAGYEVKWYLDADTLFPITDLAIKAEDANTSYFYTLTDIKSSCVGEPKEIKVSVNEIPGTPLTEDKEYPLTEGATVDISELVSPSNVSNKLQWYDSDIATTTVSSLVSLSEVAEYVYYVSELSPEKCEGKRVPVRVSVTNSTKPVTRDTSVCLGKSVDLATLVTPDEGNTLVWYNEDGEVIDGVPNVDTDNASVYNFYVSQTDGVSVSDKAKIAVNVLGVATISGENVSYCSGEDAKEITFDVDKTNCINCSMYTGVEWRLNGNKLLGSVKPETKNLTATTTYKYELTPYYSIPSVKGVNCYGEPIEILVTVAHVNSPNEGSYNYVLSDTTDAGKFLPLTQQDPDAVKPSEGHTLVWYDADMNLIGEESPAPVLDRDMADQQSFIYYVSQKDGDGCPSEPVKVNVTISKTPVPKVSSAVFCESDDDPDDLVTDFVTVSEAGYSLVWYDADPKKGGSVMTSIPQIKTQLKDPESVEETVTYYVAQTDGTTTSSAVPFEIHIFARPRLFTDNDTVCNKPVNMNSLWHVSKKVTTITTKFYEDDVPVGLPEAVTKTGNYSVEGYFLIQSTREKCISKRENIYVEIHKLNALTIDGSNSVCPNSPVTLNAIYDGETYDSDIKYTWSLTNNSTTNGEFISNPLTSNTSVVLIATDGYCADTIAHTVAIDKGEVKGTVNISEVGNSNSPVNALAGSKITYYSCGEDVTVVPNVESTDTDFKWSDGTTGKTLVTSESGIYTLTYTNVCQTYFDVEIVSLPIKDMTVPSDKVLCENGIATLQLDLQCDEEIESIVWSKDGLPLPNASQTLHIESAQMSDAGIYSYEATNRGCTISGNYGIVTVSPAPEYTLLPVEAICAGNPAEIGLASLTPSTARVEWENKVALTPASDLTAMITPSSTDVYNFRIVQDGGCVVADKIKVSVSQPISFEVSPVDTIVCQGSPAVRFALRVNEGDVLSYKWEDENGAEVSTTSLYRAETSTAGVHSYKVTLESEACDSPSEVVSMEVVSNPIIDTVVQVKYKDAEVVVLDGTGSGNYEYRVDKADFQLDNRLTVNTYGKHIFTVRDDVGCMGTYEADIVSPQITLPVVVTPNGDGDNDFFKDEVLSEAYPDAKVTIFDRTGKVIAKMPASEGWDGTYNGHRLPSTDYWYEIWIEELRKMYVGHFTLINN